MGEFWGLDVRVIHDMARGMDQEADEIQDVITNLANQMSKVQWQGPDADRFRAEWAGHRQKLNQIVTSLRLTAAQSRSNAEAQARASA
ncbi:MAG: WXG100 family type VII secretion target [Micrococcales bacterium]|nr:WXG100 family type VII secretion target [Micrococcales bacterium]